MEGKVGWDQALGKRSVEVGMQVWPEGYGVEGIQ